MFWSRPSRWAALLATVTAFALLTPGTAVAAAENISGSTSSSNWVLSNTVRRTTSSETNVSGAAQVLLNGGIFLSLRLHHGNGQQWTTAQHWSFEDLHVRKVFANNVADNFPFRVAACCVTTGATPQTWQARIWY